MQTRITKVKVIVNVSWKFHTLLYFSLSNVSSGQRSKCDFFFYLFFYFVAAVGCSECKKTHCLMLKSSTHLDRIDGEKCRHEVITLPLHIITCIQCVVSFFDFFLFDTRDLLSSNSLNDNIEILRNTKNNLFDTLCYFWFPFIYMITHSIQFIYLYNVESHIP